MNKYIFGRVCALPGTYIVLIMCVLLAVSAFISINLVGIYTGDSNRYLSLARNLAQGNGFSAAEQAPFYPEVFRAPLYPLFLSVLLRCGLGEMGTVIVQIVLYLLAAVISVKLALELTSQSFAAILVGIFLCGYAPLVRWAASITTESLCTVLFCITCYSFVSYIKRPTWWITSILGLGATGLFFTRTTYITVAVLIIALSLYRLHNRATLRYSLALSLIIVLPVAGWVIRNMTIMPGSFHPFGIGTGMALYVKSLELQKPDYDKRTEAIMNKTEFQIVHTESRLPDVVEADEALKREAIGVIRSHKLQYVLDVAILSIARQWIEVYNPGLPRPLLFAIMCISAAMLFTSYVGMFLIGARFDVLSIIAMCFSVAFIHAVFVVEARYTSPVRPVLYIFSAFTVSYIISKTGERFLQ
ncbi:MAG TPA: glycosyltransferase family 39 protein [Blastocatellia bacterium]|nr:glycosyltransferase family 39 protein [Blastocatellia bacterium]